jgi:hypothetical protein
MTNTINVALSSGSIERGGNYRPVRQLPAPQGEFCSIEIVTEVPLEAPYRHSDTWAKNKLRDVDGGGQGHHNDDGTTYRMKNRPLSGPLAFHYKIMC